MEQRRLEAEAKEYELQQQNIRDRLEAERLEDERRLQQDKETEAWVKQEEDRAREERTKQHKQESQQAAKSRQARSRVAEAYLKIIRVSRDMSVSMLGEDVLRGLPALKSRTGEFADALLDLKTTRGANPAVADHFRKSLPPSLSRLQRSVTEGKVKLG